MKLTEINAASKGKHRRSSQQNNMKNDQPHCWRRFSCYPFIIRTKTDNEPLARLFRHRLSNRKFSVSHSNSTKNTAPFRTGKRENKSQGLQTSLRPEIPVPGQGMTGDQYLINPGSIHIDDFKHKSFPCHAFPGQRNMPQILQD